MNFIKYNTETKELNFTTVYTSQVESSICIDGFDTSILKPFLQPKEVDDLSKPIFNGEIVDYAMPEGILHDDNGFYCIDRFGEKYYEDRVSLQASANEPYATDGGLKVGETAWYIQARLLWIDGAAKAQKLSGYEKKTIYVLEEDESLKLSNAKAKKLEAISARSYELRRAVVSDENQDRGIAGYYERPQCPSPKHVRGSILTKAKTEAMIDAYRIEYYRCKSLVDAAETIEAVNAVTFVDPSEW